MSQKVDDDDYDLGELYRAHREEQKRRRAERLPIRAKEIASLTEEGFTVRWLTPYQARVNEAVDLYPVCRRFHVLKGNKRGHYRDFSFLEKFR